MSHLLRNRFNVLIQEQNNFFFHFLYCAHEVFRQSLAVTYVCMQVSGPINTSLCMYVFVYMYVYACMYELHRGLAFLVFKGLIASGMRSTNGFRRSGIGGLGNMMSIS